MFLCTLRTIHAPSCGHTLASPPRPPDRSGALLSRPASSSARQKPRGAAGCSRRRPRSAPPRPIAESQPLRRTGGCGARACSAGRDGARHGLRRQCQQGCRRHHARRGDPQQPAPHVSSVCRRVMSRSDRAAVPAATSRRRALASCRARRRCTTRRTSCRLWRRLLRRRASRPLTWTCFAIPRALAWAARWWRWLWWCACWRSCGTSRYDAAATQRDRPPSGFVGVAAVLTPACAAAAPPDRGRQPLRGTH